MKTFGSHDADGNLIEPTFFDAADRIAGAIEKLADAQQGRTEFVLQVPPELAEVLSKRSGSARMYFPMDVLDMSTRRFGQPWMDWQVYNGMLTLSISSANGQRIASFVFQPSGEDRQ